MEHVPFDHVGRNIGMLTPEEQRQLQEATVAIEGVVGHPGLAGIQV